MNLEGFRLKLLCSCVPVFDDPRRPEQPVAVHRAGHQEQDRELPSHEVPADAVQPGGPEEANHSAPDPD